MANKEKIEEGLIEIYLCKPTDLSRRYLDWVRTRWLRSYRSKNDFISLIEPEAYYHAYPAYILQILSRPNVRVRLALLAEDNDVALGWSVSEGNILHYVEVLTAYRNQGIGKNLVPEKVERFTHLTKVGLKLWHSKLPDAKFNPFS